ncbi:hypothetical protein DFJ58DRAFT_914955 [Suillus subalutaceus]|uniref:uncharacterized protein n=1 Tax=Suillus subalutaceus TaxID=48586 RepID=UPI001B86767D|nr:uncharacterized protein DFJ58DRAFT_914955 [Suillus subalutaceus]KAG1848976.1 hypothetical protein DFJ58DRAFT_914955 [Suillus subalutaceus]
MALLLCAVLFCIPFVRASLPGLNDTHILTLDASDCPSCNTRTLWDIISSCGLTLFASTWTAIHLDIPDKDESILDTVFRRLVLMLTAFLAPEFVVAWAAWQFLHARQVAKAFNEKFSLKRAQPCGYWRAIWQKLVNMLIGGSKSLEDGWTETHGFFAWMGGFMLYVDGRPRGTLTPDELMQFVDDKLVEMPAITEAEIKDRSKSDLLSKWVAILQLVWFVIQLIARYIQKLPVTLLEIDTLGVAAMTCISYGLWLDKPKDVRLPYIVHWKDPTTPLPDSLDSDLMALTREKITIIIGCTSGMTRRADIVACGFHWDTIYIFGDFELFSDTYDFKFSGKAFAVGIDQQTDIGNPATGVGRWTDIRNPATGFCRWTDIGKAATWSRSADRHRTRKDHYRGLLMSRE